MKKTIFVFIILACHVPLRILACDLCQNNQPKALKGITHGTGPQGNIDFIIIWFAVIIVAITFFFSLKYLLKPKETDANHIKNIVMK
ncbi:MAG: hypothetical protein JJU28_07755 [Cyclobacteriaceae bacterium]|nr:hypothetical protein [Cyclobacteriaceae bacterium]